MEIRRSDVMAPLVLPQMYTSAGPEMFNELALNLRFELLAAGTLLSGACSSPPPRGPPLRPPHPRSRRAC